MTRIVRFARGAAAIALLILLGACAGTRAVDPVPADTRPRDVAPASGADRSADAVRSTVTRVATDMVGVPYRYGGTSPKEGFDCSGLVFYSYARAGLSVPRNSIELFKAAEKIPLDAAREGDLVFFQDQRRLSHVGIYLGGGRFVHAPSSGSSVRVSTLDSAYYRRHLVGVGRLIGT
ncbi:MAG TPA: C40 family peptidase [Gammaproteobacteria bacterium]